MALLLAVISEERRCHCPTSGSRSQEKNLKPAQNAEIQSDLMERLHARVMQLSIELSRCFNPAMRNPIQSGPVRS